MATHNNHMRLATCLVALLSLTISTTATTIVMETSLMDSTALMETAATATMGQQATQTVQVQATTSTPTATTATIATANTAGIAPTATATVQSSVASSVVVDVYGAWGAWRDDCSPWCCKGWGGKEYNETRHCPMHHVCRPDNMGYTSYKKKTCPVTCSTCSAGAAVKPFLYTIAISLAMVIVSYIIA
eukprot:gene8865-9814_t